MAFPLTEMAFKGVGIEFGRGGMVGGVGEFCC